MTANKGPFRFLVNHNPFYLISTLLLLYGLQIATDSGPRSTNTNWRLFFVV